MDNEVCYCCGVEVFEPTAVSWFNGYMKVYLCPFCQEAEYVFDDDSYWVLSCPMHGDEDIAGMVKYWDALDLFNKKAKETGSKTKRCKKIQRSVSWGDELEKLREAYRCIA